MGLIRGETVSLDVEDESADKGQKQESESTATDVASKTFTQAEVSALMAKEAEKAQRSGARTAAQKLSEDLGMSVEEAKKLIEAHNQRTEQEKTEAQRATEQAEQARKEAETAKAEAARVKHESLIERRLLKAGVPDEQLERVRKLINTGVEGSVEDIDGEIDELKADLPGLFGTTSGKRDMAPSDVSGANRDSSGADDAYTRGQKRAEQWASTTRY